MCNKVKYESLVKRVEQIERAVSSGKVNKLFKGLVCKTEATIKEANRIAAPELDGTEIKVTLHDTDHRTKYDVDTLDWYSYKDLLRFIKRLQSAFKRNNPYGSVKISDNSLYNSVYQADIASVEIESFLSGNTVTLSRNDVLNGNFSLNQLTSSL